MRAWCLITFHEYLQKPADLTFQARKKGNNQDGKCVIVAPRCIHSSLWAQKQFILLTQDTVLSETQNKSELMSLTCGEEFQSAASDLSAAAAAIQYSIALIFI